MKFKNMAKIKKLLSLFITFMIPCIVLAASKDDIGTSTMQFLKIGLNPRALAMGEAYTAVADDASSIYWNPAGLTRLKHVQLETGYDMLLESIKYGHLFCGIPLPEGYAVGLGVSHLMQPSLSKFDEFGNPLGSVKPQDTAGFLSISKQEHLLAVGVTVKYVSSRVGSAFAHAVAGDIGLILSFAHVDIAVAGQHIGGKIKFEKESEPLPQTIRSGIAVYFDEKRNIIFASDVIMPNDNQTIYTGGMEATFDLSEDRKAAIRFGYNTRAQDIDGTIRISAGFGFSFKQYTCNYAWIPYGDLGTSHRISFTLSFKEEFQSEHRKQGRRRKARKSKKKEGKTRKKRYRLGD